MPNRHLDGSLSEEVSIRQDDRMALFEPPANESDDARGNSCHGAAVRAPLPAVVAPELAGAVPVRFAAFRALLSRQSLLALRSQLDAITLRRSEDAFVDELFAGVDSARSATAGGGISARFSGCQPRYLGAGQHGMFGGRLSVPVDAPGPRVSAGLGVIPRIVRDGAEIYRDKLQEPLEADERLERLYRPYHRALSASWWKKRARVRRGGGDRLPFHAFGAGRPRYRPR